MSGDGVANLEELANARRLRVTAVIPPQYNPIRPRLRPPLVEPRRFHSSASTLSPPPPALRPPSRLRPAARFSARFHRSLSFLRLFAVAPRPITSGAPAPYPRRYASLFSFPASPFPPCSPNPPPPRPRLPSHIPSFISSLGVLLLAARSALWLDLLSFFSLPRHFLLCTMGINEEHTSKQEKRRRLSCCKLKRTGAGLPCFSTGPSSYDVDVFAGGFVPPPRARFMVSQ